MGLFSCWLTGCAKPSAHGACPLCTFSYLQDILWHPALDCHNTGCWHSQTGLVIRKPRMIVCSGSRWTNSCLQFFVFFFSVIKRSWDFSSSQWLKNPCANAGNTGLIPGLGTKTPYTAGQLSLCTTAAKPELSCSRAAATKPECPTACAPQGKPRNEQPTHCN